jgi:hypothetical protein
MANPLHTNIAKIGAENRPLWLNGKLIAPFIVVAPLISGCMAAPDLGSGRNSYAADNLGGTISDPGATSADRAPAAPSYPLPDNRFENSPQPAIPAKPPETTADTDQVSAPHPEKRRHQVAPASGTAHDLSVGVGGYVVGRQAEHLVRRTLKRQSLVAAGDTAGEAGAIGAGVAATRAATGKAITAGAEGGVAAEEGGAAARGVAAAARAASIFGGEELVGAGLGLGASELIVGGLVLGGAAVLGYELYERYHARQEGAAHGQ